MTTPCSAILGVLLAGGEASRMGQNKALLSLGENFETFLARTYDLLGQVLESRIVVTRSANIYPNYPCVLDACERKGPLGALWTALRLARFFGHKAILAVACDQPFLTYDLLSNLCQEYLKNPKALVTLYCEEGSEALEPLCAIYTSEALPIMAKALEENKLCLRDLFAKDEQQRLYFSDAETKHGLRNINTQLELDEAKQFISKIPLN